MKMTPERAAQINQWLVDFNAIQHRNTDEAGWIALKLSCTKQQAARFIEQAQRLTVGEK